MKRVIALLSLGLILSGCTNTFANKNVKIEPPKNMLIGVCPEEEFKCGYVNLKGETVLPFEYTFVDPSLTERKYTAIQKPAGEDDFWNQFYIIDNTGKIVRKLERDFNPSYEISPEGYMILNKVNREEYQSNNYGISDLNGNLVVPMNYFMSSVEIIKGGYFLTQDENHICKIKDKDGKDIIQGEFISCPNESNEGYIDDDLIILGKGDKDNPLYGMISIPDRKEVVPFEYSKITKLENGLFELQGKENISFYDKNGILDKVKDALESRRIKVMKYKNGMLIATKDKKYGIIDTNAREILPFKYEYIWSVGDGIIVAREMSPDGKEIKSYYNFKGEKIKNPLENYQKGYSEIRTCKNERCIIAASGKNRELLGLVDYDGNTILPAKYVVLDEIIKDFYVAAQMKDNKTQEYAVIDKNGNILIPFGKYKKIENSHCLL